MRLIGLLLLAASAIAAPSPRVNHVIHERRARDPHPDDWTQTGRVSPERILPLRVGLAQQNVHRLEEMLMRVSHPDSEEYGKHWSPEQVLDFFKPANETVDAVKGWLVDAGFAAERVKVSFNKGWIEVVNATASEVRTSPLRCFTPGSFVTARLKIS